MNHENPTEAKRTGDHEGGRQDAYEGLVLPADVLQVWATTTLLRSCLREAETEIKLLFIVDR